MHRTFIFSGKPSDVDTIVRRLREDYQRQGLISPVGTDFVSINPDPPRVEVKLHEQRRGVPPISRTIIADRLSQRWTRITLDIPDEEWRPTEAWRPTLEPSWELFAAELQRFGTLKEGTDEPPAVQSRRGGGPKATPEHERIRLVLGWLERKGTETQEAYCQRNGIGVSTLNKWKRELEALGKLRPPS